MKSMVIQTVGRSVGSLEKGNENREKKNAAAQPPPIHRRMSKEQFKKRLIRPTP